MEDALYAKMRDRLADARLESEFEGKEHYDPNKEKWHLDELIKAAQERISKFWKGSPDQGDKDVRKP